MPQIPTQSASDFECFLEHAGSATIVHVAGEIDIATAPTLAALLDEAGGSGTELVVVDLSTVTMLDSSGLGVLIERVVEPKRSALPAIRLVVTEPQVRRVFSITGLDSVFSIFSSRDDALAPEI